MVEKQNCYACCNKLISSYLFEVIIFLLFESVYSISVLVFDTLKLSCDQIGDDHLVTLS